MNFLPILLALSIIWFFLTPVYYHLRDQTNNKILPLFIKAANTGTSLLLAFIGLLLFLQHPETIPKELSQNHLLVLGLGLCLIGDIVLNLNFIAGGVFFFIGHVSYIFYFIGLNGFPPIAIPIITICFVLLLLYFYPYTADIPNVSIVFAGYGLTILTTSTLGILLLFHLGIYGIFFAVGSLLIVLSDLLLFKNHLVMELRHSSITALYLYFTGQFFLALGLYLPATGII